MECSYCGKSFKSEKWFSNHECKKKKLANEVGDHRLLSVYYLFDFWFRYNGLKKGSKGKSFKEFINSPYFSIFVNFFLDSKKLYISDIRDYLMYLSDNRIPSYKWGQQDVISAYKIIQERRGSGLQRAVKSLTEIVMHCDYKGIDLSDFFDTIPPSEAVRWIESGRLSPWVLLNSTRANDLFDKLSEEHIHRVAEIVDTEYWESRFKTSSDDVDNIRVLMGDLGI